MEIDLTIRIKICVSFKIVHWQLAQYMSGGVKKVEILYLT